MNEKRIYEKKKIKDIFFSYFEKPITNLIPSREINIFTLKDLCQDEKRKAPTEHCIRLLKEGREEERRKYKAQNFDYICVAGRFTKREKSGCFSLSGFASIDIDDVKDVDELRSKLIQDPYFVLLAKSCSGQLKGVIKLPDEMTTEDFSDRVLAFYHYLDKKYEMEVKLDVSTRDLARATFIAYDPQPHLNHEAKVWEGVGSSDEGLKKIEDKPKDTSRSAREFREVIKLIASGKSKEEVFEQMQAFAKWNEALPQYRELTYEKAQNYLKSQDVSFVETKEWKRVEKLDITKQLLKNPFSVLMKEIEKRIVEEEEAVHTIINTKAMELVINKKATSANLMINAETGSGKDHVGKNVLSIFPKETTLKRTRISPTALTYWHDAKSEPWWTWDGKSLYLEDISESVLNSDVFKVMASGETNSTIVINQKAVDIEIKGKPSLIITTAASNPNNEMLRRFPIVRLNETIDQTKAIMERQAEAAEVGASLDYNRDITSALRLLKRVKVKIPFARILVELFPTGSVIMRTNFDRFLDYIKGSAALHQKARSFDGEYILAEGEDYDHARKTILATASNSLMIPLHRNMEKVLELWKVGLLAKDEPYSANEIVSKVTWVSERSVRYYLNVLADKGFLRKTQSHEEHSSKPVDQFWFVEIEELKLPKWNELKQKCRIFANTSDTAITSTIAIASNTYKKGSN